MSTSVSVALRSAVTIVALVMIPLAAVLGIQAPQITRWLDGAGQSPQANWTHAPKAAAVTETVRVSRGKLVEAPPAKAKPAARLASPAFWSEADLTQQASCAAADEPRLLPTQQRTKRGEKEGAAASRSAPVADSAPPVDHYKVLEQRLRALGATQYRLETWGVSGELFRFRAMVAVAGRTSHNRYFQATDADSLCAFERVVEQVEQWRSAQRGSSAPRPVSAGR